MAETTGQIKTTTIDQLPEDKNVNELYMFGYNPKLAIGKRSVKVPFAAITPLFGVSQTVDNSTATAPCGKAVTEELAKKADLTKADGSTVAYVGADGVLPSANIPLASEAQNGAVTIEQFKFITDLIKEYPMITEITKELVPAEHRFLTQIAVHMASDTLEKLLSPIRIAAKPHITDGRKLFVTSDKKRTMSELVAGLSRIGIQPTSADDIVSLYTSDCAELTFMQFPDSKTIFKSVGIYSRDPEFAYINFNTAIKAVNLTIDCPYVKRIRMGELVDFEFAVLEIQDCTSLESFHFTNGSTTIKHVNIYPEKLKTLEMKGCTEFLSFSFATTKAPSLSLVDIRDTKMGEVTIKAIVNIWTSGSGTLYINVDTYNSLSQELKDLINTKNIAVKF